MGFLPDVLEQHADMAGSLRRLRSRVASSRLHRLADLAALDERLDAHLDALFLAAHDDEAAALSAARAAEGGAFTVAVIALRRRRPAELDREIARGRARNVVAALGWAPFADAEATTAELAGPHAEALRIAARRVHRRDPGEALGRALSGGPAVRAEALHAAGVLGRRDLAAAAARALDDEDATCRAWAAWSGTLLGEPTCARRLTATARDGGAPDSDRALLLAVRVLAPDDADALVHHAAASGRERAAVEAAAARGDPKSLLWLSGLAATPPLARLAGWAVSAITGVDLAAAGLAGEPPPDHRRQPSDDPWEREVRMDPDGRLPWPDPIKLRAACGDLAGRMAGTARQLLGQPLDHASLEQALTAATQTIRHGAALELCLAAPAGRPLFEVRAPAFRQARLLGGRHGGDPRPPGPREAPDVAAR
jgi:uncharacterized protein (TIGR02270 family)